MKLRSPKLYYKQLISAYNALNKHKKGATLVHRKYTIETPKKTIL